MRRDLRSLRFAAASLSIVGAAAGCVGILGDFNSNAGPGGGNDSGSDGAPGADGQVANDGASDALSDAVAGVIESDAPTDAGDLFLNCKAFTQPNPIVIDDLSNAPAGTPRTFNDRPGLVTVSQEVVKIVERKPSSSTFTIYTVNIQNQGNPGANGKVDVSSNENVQRVTRVPGGTGLFTQFSGGAGGVPSNEVHLFTIPDNAGPAAPPPAPQVLVQLGVTNTN